MAKKLMLAPCSLIQDTDLTSLDIRLFLFVLSHIDEQGILVFTLKHFARRFKTDPDDMMNSLVTLKNKGYFSLEINEENKTRLELNRSVFIDSPEINTSGSSQGSNSPSPNDIILLLRSSICICPSPIYLLQRNAIKKKEEGITIKRQPRIIRNTMAVTVSNAPKVARKPRKLPTLLSNQPIQQANIDFVKKPTKENQKVIDKWNSRKGIRKFHCTDTNIYKITISHIKKLKEGKLFKDDIQLKNFNKPYTVDEIIETIGNFHLALDNPGKYKLTNNDLFRLKKVVLSEFLYNSYSPFKSEFVRFIDKSLHDPHPDITRVFKQFYISKVLGGIKPESWSWNESSKFMEASEKTLEFYEKNKKKMRSTITGGNSPRAFAKIICEAVLVDANDITKISPGWFCSEITFNRRLPSYLNRQGALMVDVKKEKIPMHI